MLHRLLELGKEEQPQECQGQRQGAGRGVRKQGESPASVISVDRIREPQQLAVGQSLRTSAVNGSTSSKAVKPQAVAAGLPGHDSKSSPDGCFVKPKALTKVSGIGKNLQDEKLDRTGRIFSSLIFSAKGFLDRIRKVIPEAPRELPLGSKPAKPKMVIEGGSSQTMRRAVVVELILTLVGVAASSAALYFVMKKLDPNAAAARIAKQKKKEIAKRLGKPMIQTNQYEDIIACDVINPENIEVTFRTIGGLESVKEALHELIILPLVRPELFSHGKLLRPQKGVLLYGPPGTGKTLLAKAVAKECSAAFINVRVSSLMSKWFGDAQKLVTAVFTLAHKLQPAIIFIDEIDSILGQRRSTEHEAITSMKTEFMSLWDGFNTDDNARVMVLCATNRPWDLDEAILRRLPRTFEIPLPDKAGRANILRVILRDEFPAPSVDYDQVSAACEGYSGSDLMELCKQAAYFPLRDLLADEQAAAGQQEAVAGQAAAQSVRKRELRTADFLEALEKSPPAREAAEEYRRRWNVRQGSSSSLAPASQGSDTDAEQLVRSLAMLCALAGNRNVPNGDTNDGQ